MPENVEGALDDGNRMTPIKDKRVPNVVASHFKSPGRRGSNNSMMGVSQDDFSKSNINSIKKKKKQVELTESYSNGYSSN